MPIQLNKGVETILNAASGCTYCNSLLATFFASCIAQNRLQRDALIDSRFAVQALLQHDKKNFFTGFNQYLRKLFF